MSSIDERVVKMRIDNSQFESGVNKTAGLVSKLKQSLNFKNATDSISNVDTAIKRVNFSPLQNGINKIQVGFSAMGAAAFSVMNRVTNAAIDAGKRMVSTLTQSARDGFAEYETQMDAIQTILANTKSKGSTLQDVNNTLDDLNHYADKTIYNFTQMTKNIGTFTAAGVDLQTSANSIKGIANLAALSGSNATQASTAMYQLSQAIASGTVKLQDWNSVVNAGMGGETFQKALIRTGNHFGKNVDAIIKKEGSFRDSLTKGEWMTTQVLTETLKQLSGAYSKEQLIQQGYTEQQANDIVELAKTAEGAATDVKTFSQLIDTLKEAMGSQWTETWQIIIGDFTEAKKLWTDVNNSISGMISASGDARNKILKDWKDLGGRTALINGIANAFNAVVKVIDTVKKSFRDIIPATTGKQLFSLTQSFENFTKRLEPSKKTLDDISRITKGVASVFDILHQAISAVGSIFGHVIGQNGGSFLEFLLDMLADLADVIVKVDEVVKKFDIFGNAVKFLQGNFGAFSGVLQAVLKHLGEFGDWISKIFVKGISNVLPDIVSNVGRVTDKVGGVFSKVFAYISDGFKSLVKFLHDNISFGDVIGSIATGGLISAIKPIKKFFGSGSDLIDKITNFVKTLSEKKKVDTTFTDNVNKVLTSLSDSLNSFKNSFDAKSMLIISTSILILTNAIERLSKIDYKKAIKATSVVSVLFLELNASFKSFNKSLSKFPAKGVFSSSLAMVSFAEAVDILSKSVERLSNLDIYQLASGLTAVGSLLGMVTIAAKSMSKSLSKSGGTKDILKTAIAVLPLALAVDMLGKSVEKFSSYDWEALAKGLGGVGVVMGELAGISIALNKLSGKGSKAIAGSASMILMASSIAIIGKTFSNIAEFDWDGIDKSMIGITTMLVDMSAMTIVMSKLSGKGTFKNSASLILMATSVAILGKTFGKLAEYDWDAIDRALISISTMLVEMSAMTVAMSNLTGKSNNAIQNSISLVLMAQSISIAATAFNKLTGNSWEEIDKAIISMTAIFMAMGGTMIALGKLGDAKKSIPIALSIAVLASAMKTAASSFSTFGTMSDDKMRNAIGAFNDVLFALTLTIALLSSKFVNTGKAVGAAASIYILSKSLENIGTAFSEFTLFSWEEIGRGLTAMGGALAELTIVLAIIGKVAPLGAIGAAAAILIAAKGLSDIGKAFGTFVEASPDWGSIGRGLVAMGGALAELMSVLIVIGKVAPLGGLLAAGSLLIAAKGLNELGEAFSKFTQFSWDEIGRALTAMVAAMGALAVGSFANTLSFIGAGSIQKAAGPLGTLADSIRKWEGVTVPENLQANLTQIANGISAFNWDLLGGGSIAVAAGPLGQLADSIRKWQGVTVPENLQANMEQIANGIHAFDWTLLGGGSIAAAAEPLGTLADSMKKWQGVQVPENIATMLGGIADGIKKFDWTLLGGTSISNAAGPLGQLATSVNKWNSVKIPKGFSANMQELADGLSAFNKDFFTGGILNRLAQPMSTFADACKHWSNVYIPNGMEYSLTSIAKGMNSFKDVDQTAGPMAESLSKGVRSVASACTSMMNVNAEAIGSKLTVLINGINNTPPLSYATITDISTFAGKMRTALGSLQSSILNGGTGVVTVLNTMKSSLASSSATISNAMSQNFTTAKNAVVSNSNGMVAAINAIPNSFVSASNRTLNAVVSMNTGITNNLSNAVTSVRTSQGRFQQAAAGIPNAIKLGISGIAGKIVIPIKNGVRAGSNAARTEYSGYYSAGTYLAQGFANGIRDNISKAASAAAQMAADSKKAAMKQLNEHSPSRVFHQIGAFVAEGYANGIRDNMDLTDKASVSMASSSVNQFKTMMDSSDYDPTITPVLDLSTVRKQANGIGSLFSSAIVPTEIGANAISNRISQNGGTSSRDDHQAGQVTNNYTFNQTNNSPKSLSRYDIYKQTENQLATMRQVASLSR